MKTLDSSQILEAVERTNRLLALFITQGLKQIEAIALLAKAGLGPKEIATYLGTTANTVSVVLAGIRKASKAKKNRQSTSDANES